MSLAYRTLYGLGITPWDHRQVPTELRELVAPLPRGNALDVGCGTGTQSIFLAEQGFDVLGVDVVRKPIRVAERRALEAGVSARFVVADASADGVELGGPFCLMVDYGCMHSVSEPIRAGLANAFARNASADGTLILFAFGPRKGPGPRGASESELLGRLGADFELVSKRNDESTPLPRPLRNTRPVWYEFRRRSAATRAVG